MAEIAVWGRKILEFLETGPAKADLVRYVEALSRVSNEEVPEYFGPESKPIGHRAYDAIITSIFQSVLRGVPREELLRDALTALDRKDVASPAICQFVLEGTIDANRSIAGPVTLKLHRGLNPNVWNNFIAGTLLALADSPFIRGLLAQREPVDLWLSTFITTYAGEFDMLMSAARGKNAVGRGYWIAAMPLPPARTRAVGRVVVALYENRGGEFAPELPHGASQDWRLLQFLGLAHRVLDHQLESVAEQVHGQRTQMLTLLAPGILHHEIGHRLNTLSGFADTLDRRLKRIETGNPTGEAQILREPLDMLLKEVQAIGDIANAFNNLERRQVRERLDFTKLLQEVAALAHHRLGHFGISFRWEPIPVEAEIETDPALLLHLVFNIVLNGLAAFATPGFKLPPVGRRVIMVRVAAKLRTERPIIIEIVNNGPPIPPEHQDAIFEKGFTTRSDGHGQGLYICRLIAGALGGRLSLMQDVELNEEWAVGFRIELPQYLEQSTDLMGSKKS